MTNKRRQFSPGQKISILREHLVEKISVRVKKSVWGTLMGSRVSPSTRDEIVDYMWRYIPLTELPLTCFPGWLGVGRSNGSSTKR